MDLTKRILLVLVMLLPSMASAQQHDLSILINTSLSLTNLTSSEKLKVRLSGRAGVDAELPMVDYDNAHLAIRGGIAYAMKGAYYDAPKDSKLISIHYLEAPIVLVAKYQTKTSLIPYLTVGGYFAYGVAGHSVDTNGHKYSIFNQREDGERYGTKRLDMGVQGGIGLEMKDFLLSFDAQFGLLDINNDPAKTKHKDGYTATQNYGIFLTLAYAFRLD